MVLIPLFKDHRVLVQVSGHGVHVIKLLPSFVIDEADCDWAVGAFNDVIADCHQAPGAFWSIGRCLVEHALAGWH